MALYPTPHAPAPDDTEVQTRLPLICVDYLSHDWQEEDVWKSWRNMTRRKNEIANGLRLENASWRTWWKQRNKLRTVSPETLNWLKDSDVTWLYGPLHTAADPVPPPKVSTTEDKLNLLVAAGGKKPILKHRSITYMLTIPMPHSPILEGGGMDFDDSDESNEVHPTRPPLWHTKSDSHILQTNRRPSPTIAASSRHLVESPAALSDNSTSSLDSRTRGRGSNSSTSPPPALSDGESSGGVRKHISFNTFVQQCISIDAPPTSFLVKGAEEEQEEDDDDDEALEMHSSVSLHSARSSRPPQPLRALSSDKEHITIAPIAPTILKTSDSFPAPSPAVVFAPPQGLIYRPNHTGSRWLDLPSPGGGSTTSSRWEEDDDDDNYDYFGGTNFGTQDEYDLSHRPLPARSNSSSNLVRHRYSYAATASAVPRQGSNDRSQSGEAHLTRSRGRQATSPDTRVSDSLYRPPHTSRGILKNSSDAATLPLDVPHPSYDTYSDYPTTSALLAAHRSSSLLSPPSSDPPSRGRSSSPSESGSRGRSAVRTSSSSLSDRESSRGTSSPIGSISPSSRPPSGLGGRRSSTSDLPNRNHLVRNKLDSPPLSLPVGSKANSTVSPAGPSSVRTPGSGVAGPKPPSIKTRKTPSLLINQSVGGSGDSVGSSSSPHSSKGFDFPTPPLPGEGKPEDWWSDVNARKIADSTSAPLSASVSSSSSSTATATPSSGLPTPQATPKRLSDTTLDEEHEYRSANPTPVNSPISALRTLASTDLQHVRAQGSGLEGGTLVGRAVDIVSSAKGFLGAIWNAGLGDSSRRSASVGAGEDR